MPEEDGNRRAPKSEARDLWGPVITIVVDEKKVKVVIHKAILIETSKFFQKAVKQEWDASRPDPDTIELEHLDLNTFKLYVHWIYFRNIKLPQGDCEDPYIILAKAYVLGEELMNLKFKNYVLDTIVETTDKRNNHPNGECVDIVYRGTTSLSPARRLLVDMCASLAWGETSWMQGLNGCPREFLLDALKATVERREPLEYTWSSFVRSSADYHEAEEE